MSGKKQKRKSGNKTVLEVKRFFQGVKLPEYAMESDVGIDLRANESANLKPLEQKSVRTGIAIHIPEGHVGLIRDRAGIVTKMNVHTVAGTFDPAYRGEISVVLVNFGDDEVEIEKGMRIAQIIILPITRVEIKEVDKLPLTERYDKSFGSTGMKELIKIEKELEEWEDINESK
jgi:dUTP pyrophosphatase